MYRVPFSLLACVVLVNCGPSYFDVVISSDEDAETEREQHRSCTPESCIVTLEVIGTTTSLRPVAGLFTVSSLAVRDVPELGSLEDLEGSFRREGGIQVVEISGNNRSLADISAVGDEVDVRRIIEITGTHALEVAAFPQVTQLEMLVLDDESACIFDAPNLEIVSTCLISSESCEPTACTSR